MLSLRFIGQIMLLAVSVISILYTVQFAVWNLRRGKVATRVSGASQLEASTKQLKLHLASKRAPNLVVAAAFLISSPLMFASIWKLQRFEFVVASVASTAIVAYSIFLITEYATPASVLLLGTSSRRTLSLFSELDLGLFPYRTILLLEPAQEDVRRIPEAAELNVELNNVRLFNTRSWAVTVREVLQYIPCVVLDATSTSPAVQEEISMLASSPALLAKTVVLVPPSNTSGTLDLLSRENRQPFRVFTTVSDLCGAIVSMGLRETISVSSDPYWSRRFFRSAAVAVSRAAKKVSRTKYPLFSALDQYRRTKGVDELFRDVQKTFDSFGQSESAGVLGALRGLPRDILLLEELLARWPNANHLREVVLLNRIESTLRALYNLRAVVERNPQINDPQAREFLH